MNKIRLFSFITYSDENILIDYLSLISGKFGKYDFFTQNIRYSGNLTDNIGADSNYKIKIVSFKKLYSYDKCRFFLRGRDKIQNQLAKTGYTNFQVTCGYLNKYHVVTLNSMPGHERLYLEKNMYAQIQLVSINGRMISIKKDQMEFSLLEVKKYFEDLHSLYREQISK